MHSKYIPACTSQLLRQVEILFISRETVKKHSGRMRTSAGSKIKHSEQIAAVAGNKWMLH